MVIKDAIRVKKYQGIFKVELGTKVKFRMTTRKTSKSKYNNYAIRNYSVFAVCPVFFTVISLLNFAYNLLLENLPSKKEGYKILYEVKMGYLVISILNLTEVYDYLPHTSKKFQVYFTKFLMYRQRCIFITKCIFNMNLSFQSIYSVSVL